MKSKSLQEYAEVVDTALEKLKFELGNALKIDAFLCKSNKLLNQRLNKARFLKNIILGGYMLKEEDIENLVKYANNMSFRVEGCCTDNGYGLVSHYDLSLADLATVISRTVISRIERRNAAADVYGGPIAG